jgi:BatD DUF11 like domain
LLASAGLFLFPIEMKRLLLISILTVTLKALPAQVSFTTLVTQGPVVEGESFQVQYVLDNLGKDDEFFQPDFKNFKFISGPNFYDASAYGADGPRKLKNVVYTLVALKPGKFIVPGASARINGQIMRSDNALVEVITKADAITKGILQEIHRPDGEYSLDPGEDPYDKMRKNLFLKILVDKKDCYVGQPVTATFKLYSRLHSKSDIVKNPGLYGFTVQDMIGLNDNLTSNEKINGKTFDVHTIRKVQLYPLRAGSFTIDPMEVQNTVDFSKSTVHDKTEQEIIEGIVPDMDAKAKNTAVFENSMSTSPVVIHVKPVPSANRPAEYNGATGKFSITTALLKRELARNEEGDLVITITGRGNFTQLSAPSIQWPSGLEGFDPVVTDSLDHTQAPLKGKREFRFRFTSSKAGSYNLPVVHFAYFDPDSNHFRSLVTSPLTVIIDNRENAHQAIKPNAPMAGGHGFRPVIWISALVLLIALAMGLTILRGQNKPAISALKSEEAMTFITAADALRPAMSLEGSSDKIFYTVLRRCIWDFFTPYLGLIGSAMNKSNLSMALAQRRIGDQERENILEILQLCETGIFTDADMAGDKRTLLKRTATVLDSIGNELTGQEK